MNSIYRKNAQNGQVRNQNEIIERGELIERPVPEPQIPVIEARELVKMRPARGKNQGHEEVECVHFIKTSPANVKSKRMLT